MENDSRYIEIREQVKVLNNQYNNAVTEDDWHSWNTQLNKVGKMIEEYDRTNYNRKK